MKFRIAAWSVAFLAVAATANVTATTVRAGDGGTVNGRKCYLPGVDRQGNLSLLLGGFGRSYKRNENGCIRYTCSATVKNLSGRSFSESVRFRFGRKKLVGRLYISRPRRGYRARARLVFSLGKCRKRNGDDNGDECDQVD